MAEFTIKLEGLDKIQAKLTNPQFIAGPLRDFLHSAAFTVEGKAKAKAPVDTGRLRASIASSVEPKRAVVGTNLTYAPYVEFGTRPHFPPPSALQPWARRHGFPSGLAGAYMVARAIARHGTRAKPYLGPALTESANEIQDLLTQMVERLERDWSA